MNKLLILVLIVGICISNTALLCAESAEPIECPVHIDSFEGYTSIIPLGGYGGGGPPVPG